MHARDCVHGVVGPGQLLPLQISAFEVASGWIILRLTRFVGCKEAQVWAQLGEVPERFSIRSAEIQQGGGRWDGGHKSRAGIEPWKMPQPGPIHNALCRSGCGLRLGARWT